MASSHPPSAAKDIRRRVGQFLVGTFAGACALFAPRLVLLVGQSDVPGVSVVAVSTTFVIAATLLSLIIGGVALILEWDGMRSPKDMFMAALGVPALLSGAFSTSSATTGGVQAIAGANATASERAITEGIEVDERPQSSLTPSLGTWPPVLPLVVTAYAAEQGTTPRATLPASTLASQKSQPGGIGIQYRQVRYWVVVFEDRTRAVADQRAAALGTQYGSLSVQPLGTGFAVTLGGGALPYSDAVNRAIEMKRKSQGAVVPKLVRAG